MHCVERGIDLGWNEQALFAELYWRPETLAQTFGRFGRVGNQKGGTIIDVLSKPGSLGEKIALRLVDKFNAIGSLQRLGAVEQGLLGALQRSPEDLLKSLNDFSDIGEDTRGAWLASTEQAETAEGED